MGDMVGDMVGDTVGDAVGDDVGVLVVGDRVGDTVGDTVWHTSSPPQVLFANDDNFAAVGPQTSSTVGIPLHRLHVYWHIAAELGSTQIVALLAWQIVKLKASTHSGSRSNCVVSAPDRVQPILGKLPGLLKLIRTSNWGAKVLLHCTPSPLASANVQYGPCAMQVNVTDGPSAKQSDVICVSTSA